MSLKKINEAVDLATKTKDLFTPSESPGDLRRRDGMDILELSVVEQRQMYQTINNTFDQLRLKSLALIAGEVAIVAFLFSETGRGVPMIPVSNIILLFFAVACLVVSFGLSLWSISTVVWKVPHSLMSSKQVRKEYKTKQHFLEYLNDDYVKVNTHNSKVIIPRLKQFNWTVYLLSAGVIIVLVLKYGGQ